MEDGEWLREGRDELDRIVYRVGRWAVGKMGGGGRLREGGRAWGGGWGGGRADGLEMVNGRGRG